MNLFVVIPAKAGIQFGSPTKSFGDDCRQKGFTFLEMMVVLLISSFITFCIFYTMRLGDQQIDNSDIRMTIADSAREGLYKITQELRQSAPDRITISGNANNETIQFNIPDPADPVTATYAINWTDAKLIQYQRGGTNNSQIIRTDFSTGVTKVVANDVTALDFTGNLAQPTVVTVDLSVQRTLTNNRLMPATALQLTGQAEIRNT